MNKIKKLFGEYDLSMKKVVIFAIITALVTAIFCIIPGLKDTSFRDLGTNFDAWIVFAIFIIINSKSAKEACIYTFVFFLISQPLIYLIQVPFSNEGFLIFRYYKYWFVWTLLTIPGSLIAYQLKRKNLLSLIIFLVVSVYLGYISSHYLKSIIFNFPNHLLSFIFCVGAGILLPLVLFDRKIHKIIAIIVLLLVLVASYGLSIQDSKQDIILENNNYSYTLDNEDIVNIERNQNILKIKALKDGYAKIIVNYDNKEVTYYITVSGGTLMINILD